MADQKLENLLNLALQTSPEIRSRSQNLNVGYDELDNSWDIIVRYHGEIRQLEQLDERIRVVQLFGGYAIITLPQEWIDEVSSLEEIEYIEKPKRLYFELNQARTAACITPVTEGSLGLRGNGVLVAVLDSGIDYSHPDFRNADGTSRIRYLWDQTIPGAPPEGYALGTEYTAEEINEALASANPLALVPSTDTSGHGTHVAGIAAGNGRASQERYRGVATEAELIIVKLGTPNRKSFPRTSELMQALNYSIQKAIELQMPVSINISFGNTYGSHSGDSLLERYIDTAAGIYKNVISIGTGNEGAAAGHTSGNIQQGERTQVSLAVGEYESTVNLQLWKDYADTFSITVIPPSGERISLYLPTQSQQFVTGGTRILAYYGTPVPYSTLQEIYLDFVPVGDYIDSGVWQIELMGQQIVTGIYEMWIPSAAALSPQTAFLFPTEQLTMTIPSTASRAVTVAAYNSRTNAYADFSGRGYEERMRGRMGKPDLAAPGVDITSASPGGGYTARSGTSMATPFVAGAAALLMEYGIVRGQDPFLYGEKVKAYLQKGAKTISGVSVYPSSLVGYGALCLENSLPV